MSRGTAAQWRVKWFLGCFYESGYIRTVARALRKTAPALVDNFLILKSQRERAYFCALALRSIKSNASQFWITNKKGDRMSINFFDIASALRLARKIHGARSLLGRVVERVAESSRSSISKEWAIVCSIRRANFIAPARGEYGATPNRPLGAGSGKKHFLKVNNLNKNKKGNEVIL